MTPLDTALHWQQQGVSTVPLYFRSKMPHSRALIRSGFVKDDGRATWTPLRDKPATEQQIRQWFKPDGQYNLALVTTEHLVVLDFDDPRQYGYWFCWMLDNNPRVLDTYVVISARGIHLYFWVQESFEPIKASQPYEVKSHGRLITIPPSVHPSGVAYRAIYRPIIRVECIQDVLTFSPVELKRPARSLDPWTVRDYTQQVDLLALFPDARPSDNEGRYYLSHCPLHGHRWNFWLDTELKIAGCYGGCGQFLFSELVNIVGRY